jgi:hypothetical protein
MHGGHSSHLSTLDDRQHTLHAGHLHIYTVTWAPTRKALTWRHDYFILQIASQERVLEPTTAKYGYPGMHHAHLCATCNQMQQHRSTCTLQDFSIALSPDLCVNPRHSYTPCGLTYAFGRRLTDVLICGSLGHSLGEGACDWHVNAQVHACHVSAPIALLHLRG